jgi:hypothetical protein
MGVPEFGEKLKRSWVLTIKQARRSTLRGKFTVSRMTALRGAQEWLQSETLMRESSVKRDYISAE